VTAGRAFWLALVAFFLLGAAWATALPVNGTYDEKHHIIRAYAVVDGQWLPRGPDQVQLAPSTLLPENPDCAWNPRPPKPASCQRPAADDGVVPVSTNAARYHPVYYLPVGIPIRLAPNETGILLGRLISALLNALLLAAAVWVAVRLGNRLLVAGVALVATPTVVNLAGAINPNGLEISAAVLVFVALLALLRPAEGGAGRRTLLALAGVGAFALLTVRLMGPVLLAVDLLGLAVLAGWTRVRAELRRRDTWTVFGGFAGAGALAAVAWLLAARSPVGEAPPGPLGNPSAGEIVDGLLTSRIPFYVQQVVGQFGYGETTMSPLAIMLWYALVAVVVLPALWRGGWRLRLVLAGLTAVSLAFLIALELIFLDTGSWFSHGRYALPVLVGVVLAAAWASGASRRWYLPVGLVLAAGPVHLYALLRVLTRFQTGIDAGLNPFPGSWHPPAGPVLPIACVFIGVALLAAATWEGRNVALGEDSVTDAPRSTRTVSAH